MHRKGSGGFTLVELLVVIAIIVSVLGISLYWVNGARHTGKVTVCCRNLTAMGQMLKNYQADHRGRLPSLNSGAIPSPSNGYGTENFLKPVALEDNYLGNLLIPDYCADPTLFYCPLSSIQFSQNDWIKDDGSFSIPESLGWSYTYLGRYYETKYGHIDQDVLDGKILIECCSVKSTHTNYGETDFSIETPILFEDLSVSIEKEFKW